jgi:hypothetical protein
MPVSYKEVKMGGTCSTHGRNQETQIKYWSENLKGKDHLEDLGIDERKLLKWILKKECGRILTGFI